MGKERKLREQRKIEREVEEVQHSRTSLIRGLAILGVVLIAMSVVWSIIILKRKAEAPVKNPVASSP